MNCRLWTENEPGGSETEMLMEWICAFLAAGANAGIGVSIKGAQSGRCRTACYGAVGCIAGLCCAALLLPVLPGERWVAGVWGIGAVGGLCFAGATALNVIANRMGAPSVAWSMANMGLLVPIIFGWCGGETPEWQDFFMLLAFVLMLAALNRGTSSERKKVVFDWKYGAVLGLVFLVNGLVMLMFKWNQWAYPEANKAGMLCATYATAAICFSVQAVRHGVVLPNGPERRWGLFFGFMLAATQVLMQLAMALPAAIVFPVVQGGSLLGGVLLMAFIFKEKMNLWKVTGIFLGCLVIALSVIR